MVKRGGISTVPLEVKCMDQQMANYSFISFLSRKTGLMKRSTFATVVKVSEQNKVKHVYQKKQIKIKCLNKMLVFDR